MAVSKRIADGLHIVDLMYQGLSGVISAYVLEDAGEFALIDTGPTSTIDSLLSGMTEIGVEPQSISKILLTHIHLDHAGASGTLAQLCPEAQIYVHEVGAPHLIDPSSLIRSATRIYGDMMGPLWGDVLPVPAANITTVADDQIVTVGRRQLCGLHTPGHASHHIAYHDQEREAVFVGDVAAVRLQGSDVVRPPTPPPDFDLDLWCSSIDRVARLRSKTIFLTHFGPFEDVDHHLQQTKDRLAAWTELIVKGVQRGLDRNEMVLQLMEFSKAGMPENERDDVSLGRYEAATPFGMSVDGIMRYIRKRQEIPI
jgi:glyoxylase-like metal-dependent hydrolase (beta-lactamase superfamily II)